MSTRCSARADRLASCAKPYDKMWDPGRIRGPITDLLESCRYNRILLNLDRHDHADGLRLVRGVARRGHLDLHLVGARLEALLDRHDALLGDGNLLVPGDLRVGDGALRLLDRQTFFAASFLPALTEAPALALTTIVFAALVIL